MGLGNSFFLALYTLFNFSLVMKLFKSPISASSPALMHLGQRKALKVSTSYLGSLPSVIPCTKSQAKLGSCRDQAEYLDTWLLARHLPSVFRKYYYGEPLGGHPCSTEATPGLPNLGLNTNLLLNSSVGRSLCPQNQTGGHELVHYGQETAVPSLMHMLGTFWLGHTLYQFKKSPYLQGHVWEILSDCALPILVLTFSLVGSYFFWEIENAVPAGGSSARDWGPQTQRSSTA
ncbi:sodium bicarbonate transporter-like protein 11 [Ornithorhynchus anatinus]|uniref:sodium bicarbonate transporter-like protein 11 n=1 Tax=Ornithorhynchus anatinus TaxID=9258 RepID=UPI0019D4D43D|nr:sodium bicarbonate transporter-like protein 11 [Ornithorhynchus anatinus]